MTIDELQAACADQATIRRMLRNEEAQKLLAGNFKPGRTPYIHVVTFPNGTQLRLKFYNTIKVILNTKGQPVYGKESFLSYLDVTVAPAAGKAFCFTMDVVQSVWGTSKSKAAEKHNESLSCLAALATALGIDLSQPASWCTVYTENY